MSDDDLYTIDKALLLTRLHKWIARGVLSGTPEQFAVVSQRTMTADERAEFDSDFGVPPDEMSKIGRLLALADGRLPYVPSGRVPWVEALEMQYLAAHVAIQAAHQDKGNVHKQTLATALPRCRAFAWVDPASTAVALAAETLPDFTTFQADEMPEGLAEQFWWLVPPIDLPMTAIDRQSKSKHAMDCERVCAITLSANTADRSLLMWAHRRTYAEGQTFPLSTFSARIYDGEEFGAWYADMVRNSDAGWCHEDHLNSHRLMRFVLAGIAWLNQRIAVTSHGHVERHRRKQLAREHRHLPPLSSDVQVVALRRVEHEARPAGSTDREWTCRWVVGGHWRHQPYKTGRRVIFISPYIKGPADKPLRQHGVRVYKVQR